MDFVSDRLADGRWFRILTVVDQYTRECLCAYADRSQRGEKVVEQMKRLTGLRGAPESITTDNGGEFAGQAMDVWAHQAGVKLDFNRPGRPVQTGYIESFPGRLRDECRNGEIFFNLNDARAKLEQWRRDYHHKRPHSDRIRLSALLCEKCGLALLCYKRTFWCRIVSWTPKPSQARKNGALRHISRAWRKPRGMPIERFR
jgi:putative transposase